MALNRSVFPTAMLALLAFALTASVAKAQESGAEPTAAPTSAPAAAPASARPTVIDVEYDGKTHFTFTPYVWLPTVNGTFAFNTPELPRRGAGTATLSTSVGPNGYLAKLNFAFMGAFDLRKGDVDAFGDFITLNVSSGVTTVRSITGPLGKLQIPIDAGSSGRVASTIWELGAGYTLARGHNASIEAFSGWRQATVNATLDYNVTIGKNQLIARSGSLFRREQLSDVLFGLRGKVALGDSGWFVPYYADIGVGANNMSAQQFAGIGKAGRGGSFLLLFRNLSYDLPPGTSFIQKLRFGGPLLGYTLNF